MWVTREEMMDMEDRKEVSVMDEREGRVCGGVGGGRGNKRDTLSHSVTNDGGRSKLFHS